MRIRVDCTISEGEWCARGEFTSYSTRGYVNHGLLSALDVDFSYRRLVISAADAADIRATELQTKNSSPSSSSSAMDGAGQANPQQETIMSTFAAIQADWKKARLARETDKAEKLGTLRSDCLRKAKDATPPRDEPTEAEVQKVIKGLINGLETTRDALMQSGGKGDERIAAVESEIALFKGYQKEALDEAATRAAFDTYVSENPYGEDAPASSMKSMGNIKKFFEARYPGQYDGALLSKILKERIG
jgi:uncharacterized protein YqeY